MVAQFDYILYSEWFEEWGPNFNSCIFKLEKKDRKEGPSINSPVWTVFLPYSFYHYYTAPEYKSE